MVLIVLVKGGSLRSIGRVGVGLHQHCHQLMGDAGEACAAFRDETVRNVAAKRGR